MKHDYNEGLYLGLIHVNRGLRVCIRGLKNRQSKQQTEMPKNVITAHNESERVEVFTKKSTLICKHDHAI